VGRKAQLTGKGDDGLGVSSSVTLRSAAPEQTPAPAREPAALAAAPARQRPLLILVAVALALLTVLAGCTIPGLSSEPSPESGSDAEASPGTGTDWFWYQQGERVASPSTPAGRAASASATAPAAAAPATEPIGSGRPYCLTRLRADTMYWLSPTPGVGQASVSWMSLGDPRIVEYKLAAVLQNRPGGSNPPLEWTSIPKPDGCREMSATVTGLTRGSYYVFWLDVVVVTRPTGRREPMIGRSAAFLVL
jgi:hypothetical protein